MSWSRDRRAPACPARCTNDCNPARPPHAVHDDGRAASPPVSRWTAAHRVFLPGMDHLRRTRPPRAIRRPQDRARPPAMSCAGRYRRANCITEVADNPPAPRRPARSSGVICCALGPRGRAGAEGMEGALGGRDVRVQRTHLRRVPRHTGGQRVLGMGCADHHPNRLGAKVAARPRQSALQSRWSNSPSCSAAAPSSYTYRRHSSEPRLIRLTLVRVSTSSGPTSGSRHLLQDDIAHSLVLGRLPHHVRHYCLPRWNVSGAAPGHPRRGSPYCAPSCTNKQAKRLPAMAGRRLVLVLCTTTCKVVSVLPVGSSPSRGPLRRAGP